MKAFSSLILALFLLLTLSSASAANLEEICKKLSQQEAPIDFNFCLTSLQVDPNSRKVDTQGLAIIAANLGTANFTHNKAKANELLNSKGVSKKMKAALQVCVANYDVGLLDFAKAIRDINSRDYFSANIALGAASTDVVTCIDAWHEVSETSPMAKEEGDAEEISRLALDVLTLLQ